MEGRMQNFCHFESVIYSKDTNMGIIISSNKKDKKTSDKKKSIKVEPKNNERELENLNPNFILVTSNDNSEQLPIKKRYRYEVTDLKEIMNGNTYLVKSPSKKLSPEAGRKKSKSCLKLNDLEDGEKNGSVGRSRSQSPRKAANSVTFKSSPRKKSKEKKIEKKDSKDMKDLKDLKDSKESKTITEQIKHILDTPKKELKSEAPPQIVEKYEQEKNNKNDSSKAENVAKDFKNNNIKSIEANKKKSNYDSLIENPDTNPMNPISDKDLNILETIRYYLDSVKQNNYQQESRTGPAVSDSPTKTAATLRIQSTRSSKLRAKSAKRRLELQQQFEELHIGPFY